MTTEHAAPGSRQPSELEATARTARRWIIQVIHKAQAGHLGGPLACTDLLVALYFHTLRIRPDEPRWPERDRFILSKGHSSIALYVVLALRGYFPTEELWTFDAIDSRLQGHPDMSVLPGLDMSTGSLGQGLSPGVGMAIGAKRKGLDLGVWVIMGDGEIQEGQVWEAAWTAYRFRLDNLVAIVDYNRLPQYGWPGTGMERKEPMDNPRARWEAFGWRVVEIDGHDMSQIVATFDEVAKVRGRQGVPTLIVAHTVKGKGVSFMEHDYLWHARPLTDTELETAVGEIGDDETAGGM
ncbi:MAG: transketolase [Chloroflexota bacterium]